MCLHLYQLQKTGPATSYEQDNYKMWETLNKHKNILNFVLEGNKLLHVPAFTPGHTANVK